MTEFTKELDRYIDMYSDELENIDCSAYEDYEFSPEYKAKMSDILKSVREADKPKITFTFKRALMIASVAILLTLSTIANLAIVNSTKSNEWQTSEFNITELNDHSEVYPKLNGNYKTKIENEYSIEVPKGYVLCEDECIKSDDYSDKSYKLKKDPNNYLYFSQNTAYSYSTAVDNQQAKLKEKKDKYGNSVLIYKHDNYCTIIWSNEKYIFELEAHMTEDALMDIYYSVK